MIELLQDCVNLENLAKMIYFLGISFFLVGVFLGVAMTAVIFTSTVKYKTRDVFLCYGFYFLFIALVPTGLSYGGLYMKEQIKGLL